MDKSKLFRKIRQYLVINKKTVGNVVSMATAATQWAIWKTPLALFEGVVKCIDNTFVDDVRDSKEYFNRRNGWHQVFDLESYLHQLFVDVLEEYPSEILPLSVDWSHNSSAKVIDLPVPFDTQIGLEVLGSSGDVRIYYRPDEIDQKLIVDFLVESKKKRLNSNYLYLKVDMDERDERLSLHAESLDVIPSRLGDKYTSYINNSLDNGIHRSIVFYGQPGTGKTILANTIVSNLGLRALKIRNNDEWDDLHILTSVIKLFDIQAVIINDFDQSDGSNKMFEFVEFLSAKCKVVIATVNSLKPFHPALIRPGRFDEIIKVDRLDKDTVSTLLGDLSDAFLERCKSWPVAFVQELVRKSRLVEANQLTNVFRELNARVKKQVEYLKDVKDGTDDKALE